MDTRAILHNAAHRTTPIPTGPWVMTQTWHELLFAHWPMKPEKLRPLIPPVFTLDTFEREAWVGVVPFRMSNVRPRGVPPVPRLSAFPELNVRTYVTVHGIPGVYFFSLDAGNPIAVAIARTVFHLPYFNAVMSCKRVDDTIHYNSHRIHHGAPDADFVAHYRPVAPVKHASRNTLAYWFTERYCLYTTDRHGKAFRGNIHHVQWPLQPAELEISKDTMARSHNIELPDTAPLLHYSERQEVLIWPLKEP
jgi:uncharacterized protein